MKRTTLGILMIAVLALTSGAFAQMGGGMMGQGYGGGGQGGGGMMGGGQGYGPGPGYGPSPQQSQPAPNLTPEEQKARAKAFVEDYIRRYLPDYKLEKRDNKNGK